MVIRIGHETRLSWHIAVLFAVANTSIFLGFYSVTVLVIIIITITITM